MSYVFYNDYLFFQSGVTRWIALFGSGYDFCMLQLWSGCCGKQDQAHEMQAVYDCILLWKRLSKKQLGQAQETVQMCWGQTTKRRERLSQNHSMIRA